MLALPDHTKSGAFESTDRTEVRNARDSHGLSPEDDLPLLPGFR
jgi:hypothetical protein